MRISDWSSDVWSSDLAGAVSRIQTCEQLEDALEGVDYVQESLPEIVELKKEIFGRLDRLSPPAAVLASSTSSIPASAFRSEEHTSELQSLMRISYAVFCLKKKKKQTKKQKNQKVINSNKTILLKTREIQY